MRNEGFQGGRPALFLDRDGVIVEEVGFLSRPSDLRLIPGAGRALARVRREGIPVVVVTNQSGVARGFFPEETVSLVHRALERILAPLGAGVDLFQYCPHHPVDGIGPYKKDCPRRKPNPGMLLDAARLLGLDLERSFMVGDRVSDLLAGERAGCRSILVRTGYGKSVTKEELADSGAGPFLVADDLAAAVDACLPYLAGREA